MVGMSGRSLLMAAVACLWLGCFDWRDCSSVAREIFYFRLRAVAYAQLIRHPIDIAPSSGFSSRLRRALISLIHCMAADVVWTIRRRVV